MSKCHSEQSHKCAHREMQSSSEDVSHEDLCCCDEGNSFEQDETPCVCRERTHESSVDNDNDISVASKEQAIADGQRRESIHSNRSVDFYSQTITPSYRDTHETDGTYLSVPNAEPISVSRVHHTRMTSVIGKKLDGIPLVTKLVTMLLALLVVAFCVVAIATQRLVWNDLIERIDSQLVTQAELVASNIGDLRTSKLERGNPTDYYLQIHNGDNQIIANSVLPPSSDGTIIVPNLPTNDITISGLYRQPFSVSARIVQNSVQASGSVISKSIGDSNIPWRVVAVPWHSHTTTDHGVVYVALSLRNAIETAYAIARYFLFVGIAILFLATLAGGYMISRTLSPLKKIEKTAAKIASGDLSQRIQQFPRNTEVGSLASSLNVMLTRIETAFNEQEATNRKMKRFVSDASHELRTPLAAIHGYAELYRMQRESPGALERADESIRHIQDSSVRMTELVESLLSLARLDEGRGVALDHDVTINHLINESCADLHALDPDRQIHYGTLSINTFSRSIADEEKDSVSYALTYDNSDFPELMVKGDSSRLRQVLTNIIGNIHRYTPHGTPVDIALAPARITMKPSQICKLAQSDEDFQRLLSAAKIIKPSELGVGSSIPRPEQYVILQIIDHGQGVSSQTRNMLFERFYTANPSRDRKKGGTGLGLAIVRSVVAAHRGYICATDTPDHGLTFTIILPVDPTSCKRDCCN